MLRAYGLRMTATFVPPYAGLASEWAKQLWHVFLYLKVEPQMWESKGVRLDPVDTCSPPPTLQANA